MRLNLGMSFDERCRAELEWHKHFAILPVKIAAGDWRYFETVERKVVPLIGGCGDSVMYRAVTS